MIKDYQLFKETINTTIQNSGLDIGVVYFIIKDVFFDLEKLYFRQINRELLEEQNTKNIIKETT